MSRKTFSWNAFESALNGPIDSSQDTILLDSSTNLRAPGYLVIEPDSTSREYIKFTGLNGDQLTGVVRNLAGGVAGAHPGGAVVRAMTTHQELDDIFADIEDLEAADAIQDGLISGNASSAGQAIADAATAQSTADAAQADLDNHKNLAHPQAAAELIDHGFTSNNGYTITGQVSVYEEVDLVTLPVPADWVTYDIIVRASGLIHNNTGTRHTGEVIVHADDPALPVFGNPGAYLPGARQQWDRPGSGATAGFHVMGKTAAPVARADLATVSAAIGALGTGAVAFNNTTLEVEIRKVT